MNRQVVAQQQGREKPPDLGSVLRKHPEFHRSVESVGVPAIVHEVLGTFGQPLERDARSFMESRFSRSFGGLPLHGAPEKPQAGLAVGPPADQFEAEAERAAEKVTYASQVVTPGQKRHDFSQVKVHTDKRAAESARALNARAYTVGRHIVFGEGEYAPHSSIGRELLAHELTHTLQQASPLGARPDRLQRSPASSSPGKPTLRRGDRGVAVRSLQEKLLALGYELPRFGADGIFGPETEAAVRRFQKDAGAVLVDGIVGLETERLLDRQDARQEKEERSSGRKIESKAQSPTPKPPHEEKKDQSSPSPLVETVQDRQDKTAVRPVPFSVEEKLKLHEVTSRMFRAGFDIKFTYSLFGTANMGLKNALLTFSKDSVSFNFDGKSIEISGISQAGDHINFSLPVGKALRFGSGITSVGVKLLYTTNSVPFQYVRKGFQLKLQLSAQLEIDIEPLFPPPEWLHRPDSPGVPFPVIAAEVLEALAALARVPAL